MNSNSKLNPKPNLIVLAHSKTWASLVRRTFEHANLHWILDVDDLEAEARTHRARVAIIEFPTARVDSLCLQLSPLNNNSWNLKIFAVGESDLYHWRKLLRAAGIAMSCWSTLQAGSLSWAIDRHLQTTIALDHHRLESVVESDLPWPTAANDATA